MNYHIAKTIKEIRRLHNLTQDELAERIDKSPGLIGMLEQGRSKPSYDTMDKLITVFNLDANIFFVSRKESNDLIASEIIELLQKLTKEQAHELVQLFRAAIQIVRICDPHEYENSDM